MNYSWNDLINHINQRKIIQRMDYRINSLETSNTEYSQTGVNQFYTNFPHHKPIILRVSEILHQWTILTRNSHELNGRYTKFLVAIGVDQLIPGWSSDSVAKAAYRGH